MVIFHKKKELSPLRDAKKTISTTIPLSCYEYAKTKGFYFSDLLTNAIKEYMGEETPITKQELKRRIKALSDTLNGFNAYLETKLGKETYDKLAADFYSTQRIKERLEKEKT